MQSISHISFLYTFCKAFHAERSNSCIYTPIKNWTHVYMNLFTRNSPSYHQLKYLLFLLKHPIYSYYQRVSSLITLCAWQCVHQVWYVLMKKRVTEMSEIIEEQTNGRNRVRSDRLLITGGSENWPSRPSDMSCMKMNALE